jgi:predicted nucleotidyltransferase
MAEQAAAFRPASLLGVLNDHGVAYVLIGGIAARAYGANLHTGDADICPQDTPVNAERLAAALVELDARVFVSDDAPALTVPFDAAFVRTQRILNLLTKFGRLDVIWTPAGTGGYDELAVDARRARMRGVDVPVASLDALIATKAATDRDKDRRWLAQLRFLRAQGDES